MLREADASGTDAADQFFNRFDYAQALRERRYYDTLQGGLSLLKACKRIDAAVYARIHKGTPFYWLGMAAFSSVIIRVLRFTSTLQCQRTSVPVGNHRLKRRRHFASF